MSSPTVDTGTVVDVRLFGSVEERFFRIFRIKEKVTSSILVGGNVLFYFMKFGLLVNTFCLFNVVIWSVHHTAGGSSISSRFVSGLLVPYAFVICATLKFLKFIKFILRFPVSARISAFLYGV